MHTCTSRHMHIPIHKSAHMHVSTLTPIMNIYIHRCTHMYTNIAYILPYHSVLTRPAPCYSISTMIVPVFIAISTIVKGTRLLTDTMPLTGPIKSALSNSYRFSTNLISTLLQHHPHESSCILESIIYCLWYIDISWI